MRGKGQFENAQTGEMNTVAERGQITEPRGREQVLISLVLPVYNEQATIEKCIEEAFEVLQEYGLPFEIIAVDDGSEDQSGEILQGLRVRYRAYLRIAKHLHNKGNGAALRTGIRLSRGEVVVTMDTDGQHSPREIPNLLAKIPPYDMVVGARPAGYRGSLYRNLANRFYNRFASWLAQYPIQDLTSGYRAMRRTSVTHFLPIYPAGFSSPTTVTLAFLKAGYSVAYVPIKVEPRTKGTSKIDIFRDGGRFLVIILRMIILYDPLRIFLPVTLLLFILGSLSMVVGIWAAERLVVPGSAVVLFIAAVLSFLMGLLSHQISAASIPYYGDEFIYLYENPGDKPKDK